MRDTLISTAMLRDRLAELEDEVARQRRMRPEGDPFFVVTAWLLREVKDALAAAEADSSHSPAAMRLAASSLPDCALGGAPESIASLRGLTSVPVGRVCGIYFLVSAGEVVYVGQSVNVLSRLTQHEAKDFDAAFVLPVPRPHLDEAEWAFIHRLSPRLNYSVPPASFSKEMADGAIAALEVSA